MKSFKLRVTVLFVALLIAALPVKASSFCPGGLQCDVKFSIRRADPDSVVKDGVIYPAEYDRIAVPTDGITTPLTVEWGDSAYRDTVLYEIVPTVEYYFSWDEVHGFNFAVRFRPGEFIQTIPMGKGDVPGYDFLSNLGIMVEIADSVRGENVLLSCAVSRDAATGTYLYGHNGNSGFSGSYLPEPLCDVAIAFSADGYVTGEWSIPFCEISRSTPKAGDPVFFTVGVYYGTASADDPFTDCGGVVLGDFGVMSSESGDSKHHAVAVLSDERIVSRINMFRDVDDSAWYSGSVEYVYLWGLMNGVSSELFDPDGTTTRAQAVTVLYRLSESPKSSDSCPFTDLSGDWYRDAVKWAYGVGVVKGVSPERFDPDGKITREQLVTIIYRYAQNVLKTDYREMANITAAADYSEISSYARDAFAWAVGCGIVEGIQSEHGVLLAPCGRATRAQLAAILQRFMQSYINTRV